MNKVIDPGHKYELLTLDGAEQQILTFVKRFDSKDSTRFPGNTNAYAGTTVQSVVHALIDRVNYLHNQIPHRNNLLTKQRLLEILWLFEDRAAERHGYSFDYRLEDMEKMPLCSHCGHKVCVKLGNAHS